MARDYVCLYHSYLGAIQALGDAERGRLFTAMLEYSLTGATGHLSGNERFVFPMIKAQIDRDKEKYESKCLKNRENGKMGANASERKRTQANAPHDKGEYKGKGKDKGKGKGDEVYSAEPQAPSAPPIIRLPLNDGTEYDVSVEQCQEWAGLCPAVDVIQQLRAMRGWLDANPSRRKTKSGIKRFIVNWLSKEQNKGAAAPQKGGNVFAEIAREEGLM